ncbi:MAG: hypothetical protein DBP02_19810 [gamma proteobacterium symbiont of Ctena orbiculata]|nr:MAG: hypothetical protein DBP02_19810 [gamma proteobacterium symbiont of Ctena orbiculata]
MNIENRQTKTYILTDLDSLDPVTVYVTNYEPGRGKVVVECFGKAWAYFWGSMGELTLQQFFVSCNNDYILNKLLEDTRQTDFEEINNIAHKNGSLLCVSSDIEVALAADEMSNLFGPDWFMDLPTCNTSEYVYLGRIVNAIKEAFTEELRQAA